ncbi:MAG: hypothetical protein ACI9FD_002522, partial [Gammaproteobacteria bacterium]
YTNPHGTYVGEWVDGKIHGFGLWKGQSSDGSAFEFEGQFESGEPTEGVGTDSEGTYVGEYKDWYRHGVGTMKYLSGVVYEGRWYVSARRGYGKLSYPGGSVFEGRLDDDSGNQISGEGTLYEPDGDQQIGSFSYCELLFGWYHSKTGRSCEVQYGSPVKRGCYTND